MISSIIREIEVLHEDIDEGQASCPFRCPVATALHRMGFEEVMVGSDRVHYEENGVERVAQLPADVTQRIDTYDKTGKMTPFKFNLECPVE